MATENRLTPSHVALALALALALGHAHAALWKTVGVVPGRTIYLDLASAVRSGESAQAWELEGFASGQSSDAWQGIFHAIKTLTNYDCQRRTAEPMLRIYLGQDGAEIKREQMQGLQFPAVVEPDSLREKMLRLACNPPEAPRKPADATGRSAANPVPAAEVKAAEPPKPETAKVATVEARAEKKETKVAGEPKAEPVRTSALHSVPQTAKRAKHKLLKPAGKRPASAVAKLSQSPSLRCPEPSATAPQTQAQPRSEPSPPHVSDAGSEGLFN